MLRASITCQHCRVGSAACVVYSAASVSLACPSCASANAGKDIVRVGLAEQTGPTSFPSCDVCQERSSTIMCLPSKQMLCFQCDRELNGVVSVYRGTPAQSSCRVLLTGTMLAPPPPVTSWGHSSEGDHSDETTCDGLNTDAAGKSGGGKPSAVDEKSARGAGAGAGAGAGIGAKGRAPGHDCGRETPLPSLEAAPTAAASPPATRPEAASDGATAAPTGAPSAAAGATFSPAQKKSLGLLGAESGEGGSAVNLFAMGNLATVRSQEDLVGLMNDLDQDDEAAVQELFDQGQELWGRPSGSAGFPSRTESFPALGSFSGDALHGFGSGTGMGGQANTHTPPSPLGPHAQGKEHNRSCAPSAQAIGNGPMVTGGPNPTWDNLLSDLGGPTAPQPGGANGSPLGGRCSGPIRRNSALHNGPGVQFSANAGGSPGTSMSMPSISMPDSLLGLNSTWTGMIPTPGSLKPPQVGPGRKTAPRPSDSDDSCDQAGSRTGTSPGMGHVGPIPPVHPGPMRGISHSHDGLPGSFPNIPPGLGNQWGSRPSVRRPSLPGELCPVSGPPTSAPALIGHGPLGLPGSTAPNGMGLLPYATAMQQLAGMGVNPAAQQLAMAAAAAAALGGGNGPVNLGMLHGGGPGPGPGASGLGPSSNVGGSAAAAKAKGAVVTRRLNVKIEKKMKDRRVKADRKASTPHEDRKCMNCGTNKTPQWRAGPQGHKTLCNACGVRYKAGRL